MRVPAVLAVLFVSLPTFAEGLRLFNPTESAARVAITCEGTSLDRVIAPHAIDDVDGRGCTAATAAPLLVLERGSAPDGVEWQRAIGPASDTCPSTVPMIVPSSACRFGTAAVAVDPVPGASYSWSIEGGSFLAGSGTERVTVALEGGDSVKLSVAIVAPGCTQSAAGVIALRDSFQIARIDAGAGALGQSRTIAWSYANGAPSSQVLTGSDFGTVALAADARSYSYVPATEGEKNLVLEARSGAAPTTRRRASGKGPAGASDCSTARVTATYHVDCAPPDATIIAPSATNIETPFTARVNVDATASASWTIANGTPATATGPSVTIKPAGTSPVDIGVTVVSGSCSAKATKRVAVDGTFACDNPTVTVAVLSNDCNDTVLQARFVGKAPFTGRWSDGQQFSTNDRTLQRSVTAAGSYSIASFSDAICAGTPSNSVTVTPKIVKATLSAPNGACATNTIVATFVGTPPFAGTWSDGVAFNSDTTQMTRTAASAGLLSLSFHDSTCPFMQNSNTLLIDDGVITVSFDRSSAQNCTNTVVVDADVAGGTPPFSITWLDGVTQSQPAGSSVTHFVRSFSVPLPSGTFGVASGHDAVCKLRLAPSSMVSATGKPSAVFSTSGTFCPGTNATATLYNTPPAGASIVWTIQNGSIVSGQGTRSITFTGNPGSGALTCQITTADGCTDASGTNPFWTPPPNVPKLTLAPDSTVPVGTTVTVSWPFDTTVLQYTITASTSGNQPTTPSCSYNTHVCSSTYLAKTAGTVALTVHAYGRCGGSTVDGTAMLTVTP